MFPRLSFRKKRPDLDGYESVAVRLARSKDESAIRRIAKLDGKRPPVGSVLVAEADAEIVAAVPLGQGQTVANPFRPTIDVVALMELRAEQLG